MQDDIIKKTSFGHDCSDIVKRASLPVTSAKEILKTFEEYFSVAEQWQNKALSIIVHSEADTDMMQLARTGRLLLRSKRIEIEARRKKLKEDSLRYGQAVDAIAKLLKSVIVPLEDHLDKQENYVKYKKQKEAEEKMAIIRAENEAREKAERDRREKEEAEARKKLEEESKILRDQLIAEKIKRENEIKMRKKAEANLKKQTAIVQDLECQKQKLLSGEVRCPKCNHVFKP